MKKVPLALSYDLIKMHIRMENKKKKQMVWIAALITAVLCLVFAGLYLARFSSVVNWQSASSKPDWTVYDTACYPRGSYATASVRISDDIFNLDQSVTAQQNIAAQSASQDDLWTDPEEALSLQNEILVDCDADC